MHGIESIEKKAQPPAVGPLPSPVEPDRQKRQQRPPLPWHQDGMPRQRE